MTYDAHVNFGVGSVTVAPSTPTAGTSMTVTPSASVVLPATPFTAVVAPAGSAPTAANAEVVRCTNVAGSVWTIARAQESSTARSILIGDQVFVGGVTAKTLTDIESSITGLSFNIKTYGAVGDGVTNDTAAIAAALTAAGAVKGVVFSPPGTYMTAPFVLPDGVIVEGSGEAGTSWKLIAGSNADLCQTVNFTSLRGGSSDGPSMYGFRNITLDANGVNQTGVARCYASYGYNHIVDNVLFLNGLTGGVYSEWGGSATNMEGFWRGYKIFGYMGEGAVGLDWNGPHDSQHSNFVIATLNSTIRPVATLGSYGTTPFNGATLTIPSNSANGGAGTFTFATTVATDPLVFPLTGGQFLVPTITHLETYAIVKYASAATVGSVTTFSGCTCTTPSNRIINSGGSITQPAYGMRINKGAYGHGETGMQLTGGHIWGRNHIALVGPFFAGNMEVEGAFVVNVVMYSHNTYQGVVYGSSGQAGQTNESGIQIGDSEFGANSSRVDATVFNVGGGSSTNGCAAQVVNSANNNVVKVSGSGGNPAVYASPYSGSSDFFEAHYQNNATFNKYYDYTYSPRIMGAVFQPRVAPAYSASITPNANSSPWQQITVTNNTAFTINAPGALAISSGGGGTGELTIEILNSSGGAMGAITWNAAFLFLGFTWANPASTKRRYATFRFNGFNWLCTSMSTVDY